MVTLYGSGGFYFHGTALDKEELETLLYNSARILSTRGYPSAAGLLQRFPFQIFAASNDFNDDFCVLHASVPLEQYEELRKIADDEEGKYAFYQISEVITELGTYIRSIACELEKEQVDDSWRTKRKLETRKKAIPDSTLCGELIKELQAQRDLMIEVATGVKMIQDVNRDYELRRPNIIAQLQKFGLSDPSPFTSLWQWYEKWKASEDLRTYQSRRRYVSDLYDPIIETLMQLNGLSPTHKPTGWHRVDRAVYKMKTQLATSDTEEGFQTVGLLCREILISLAQAVFDPNKHQATDSVQPSETDAYRMIEAYISTELPGDVNDEARRHTKTSLALANKLQHKRSASYRDAALCSEATASLVNSIAIIAGRHQPQKKNK